MLTRLILPALFGLLGVGVLSSLGFWQLDRAAQKDALIAEMEARIFAAPQPLPTALDPDRDRYTPVTAQGRFTEEHTLSLASQKAKGPGFHLISVLETEDGRRVLVDRGFLPAAEAEALAPATGPVQVAGNLHWPRDGDRFTPDYDAGRNLFFARDVDQMSALLRTEPVLIVLRTSSEPSPPATPVPVFEVTIPDNHMGYAVQWFLMAIAWAGMTVFLLWRIRQQRDEGKAP